MANGDLQAVRDALTAACADRVYSTESDAPLDAFTFEGPLTIGTLLERRGILKPVAASAFATFLAKAPGAKAAKARVDALTAALAKLDDAFAYTFAKGQREAMLVGGRDGDAWVALAPIFDAYQDEFSGEDRPELDSEDPAESDAADALRELVTGLALFEPDANPGEIHTTEPLWAIGSASSRAAAVDQALAQSAFVHVRDATPFGEYEDLAPIVAELEKLSDVRTYFAGWSAEWEVIVVGTTTNGVAGVATSQVWT